MSGKRCTGVSRHSCARLLTNKTPVAMLYLLADHARDDGYAWPSQEGMAELMNMSVKQVRRTINKLEDAGDLIVKRNRGKGNSNEYLVTPGLSDEQICETLITYNMSSNPIPIVRQMHTKRKATISSLLCKKGASKSSKKGTSEGSKRGHSKTQKGTSEGSKRGHSKTQKGTSENPKGDISEPNPSQKGTSGDPKPDTAMSPEPLVPEPSNSLEPSEREPSGDQFSLSNNSAKNKSAIKTQSSALIAENQPTQEAKPTNSTKSTSEAKKTPPSSAAPPPTGLQETAEMAGRLQSFQETFQKNIEALYEACSKRPSRRNRPKFAAVARALHADGFTADQILLTRRWWDEVGMGSRGKTAPHPSQIEESISEAIAWGAKQAQQALVTSSPSEEEYTQEEVAILEAQLKEVGLI